MKFDYIMDPGHGWLKVPKALLAQLGIADKISPYSYQRGECSDRESRVRHYEGYKA
jgi:hypothetical protein